MHIYKWTHKTSGKSYIGQSVQQPEQRKLEHKSGGYYLYHAMQKHGEEAFTHEVIDWADSIEELNELEKRYITEYDTLAPNGYNLREGGGNKGRHHPDSIEKMKQAHKALHASGKKKYGWTRKDGGSMLGKTQSETQKAMMREVAKIQVACPHCGKEGQRAAMGRWHFDNCKENAR